MGLTCQLHWGVHLVSMSTGEDRWLCTLIIQAGRRIEYSSISDALTYAPEGFFDFFKQRLRWVPSTMANLIDLLLSASTTVKHNNNISL